MAAFPAPEKIAGPFLPQFEIYWKQLDREETGKVQPGEVAAFLRFSGLSDQTLGKIWDLSDQDGNGYLDRTGLFVACKLVSLSQASREIMVESILDECNAPYFGDKTAPGAPVAAAPRGTPAPSINFLVKPEEKRKYDTLFDQLRPQAGLLPGDKVRNVMMGSKLPVSMLGKIWDLSDQDKDGLLDRYEFTVAMHLVYRALQGDMIPDQLPTELSKEKVPVPLSAPVALPDLYNGAVPRPSSTPTIDLTESFKSNLSPTPQAHTNGAVPLTPAGAVNNFQAVPWVVNAGDRLRYEALFKQTDSDKDGFVSGVEIKNLLLQTGLPQNILAHIWNLSDIKQEGKLNPEQFALCMYLIHQKQAGKDPPAQLTPDMIPPSMRPKGAEGGAGPNRSVYNNPELEEMAKEIQALLQEKMMLEREVQDQEYQISAKNSETHSLQTEFNTLNTTLTQLTNQKNVAQKRLDDLDGQTVSVVKELQDVDIRTREEQEKILKLRGQAEEQEQSLKVQEEEVHSKKRELDVLIEEEARLNSDIKKSQREMENLVKSLSDVEKLLEETDGKCTEYEELEAHLNEASRRFDQVLGSSDENLAQNVPEMYLEPIRYTFSEPDFSVLDKPSRPARPEAPAALSPTMQNGRLSSSDDPFSNPSVSPAEANNLFNNDDAFAAFNNKTPGDSFDPFSSFSSSGFVSGNTSAFPSNFTTPNSFNNDKDPFAAFGTGFNNKFSDSPVFDGPPALAPRPGENDSPTPALPPKGKGGPPKRPPPPRRPPPPKAGPAMAEPEEPFGAAAASEGFADFSAFESQPETTTSLGEKSFDPDSANFQSRWTSNFDDNISDAFASKNDPFSGKARYSGLEFSEDPFKNNNYRYADPFEENSDPFSAPDSQVFGSDPFASSAPVDPFKSEPSDPFSPQDKTYENSLNIKSDPFGKSDSDPFGSGSFSPSFNSAPNKDPFGSNIFGANTSSNFSSSNDPFSLTNLKPASDHLKTSKPSVSTTTNTVSYRKEKLSSDSSVGDKTSKKKSSHSFSDFLTGSPLKLDKGDKSKDKKDKKHGKFHLTSPLKTHKKESPSIDKKNKNHNEAESDEIQIKMAAEMSLRADEERRRKLELQEEADLAYAIALSKAEAASLK